MLADPRSEVIRRFGMLNPDNTPDNIPDYAAPNVAYPGYFLIDLQGRVVERFIDDDYNQRLTAGNVLARLFPELIESAAKMETPHLRLAVGQSDREVGPGSRVTLTADLSLPAGMHVYAPGVRHYKPVELVLEGVPAGSVEKSTLYPPSQVLRLPVIDEEVPVFTGNLRLSKEVTLSSDDDFVVAAGCPGDDGKALTLKGVLRYQACDDQRCYPPAAVPITWDFKLRQLDWQRPAEENRRRR